MEKKDRLRWKKRQEDYLRTCSEEQERTENEQAMIVQLQKLKEVQDYEENEECIEATSNAYSDAEKKNHKGSGHMIPCCFQLLQSMKKYRCPR